MTVRDRIARALVSPDLDAGRWDDLDPNQQVSFLAMADDALAALEQPTPEMISAGRSAQDAKGGLLDIWRAMIGAAKGGPDYA